MAVFKKYECEKCGYKMMTEPAGWYATMKGCYYLFRCSHCKEIITYSSEELQRVGTIACKGCGEVGTLSTWNPVDGPCPQCGGKMKEDEHGRVIMVD